MNDEQKRTKTAFSRARDIILGQAMWKKWLKDNVKLDNPTYLMVTGTRAKYT